MSVELFFRRKGSQESFRVGPLGRDIDGFAARLAAEGYAHTTATFKLWLLRSLSRWLDDGRWPKPSLQTCARCDTSPMTNSSPF